MLEAKYAGYIDRQAAQVERFQRLESQADPGRTSTTPPCRSCGPRRRRSSARVRPASLGQASRISGISPADLAVLLIYLE